MHRVLTLCRANTRVHLVLPAARRHFSSQLSAKDTFARRHVGPRPSEVNEMLKDIRCSSMEQLINEAIPSHIRMANKPALPAALSESEVLKELKDIMSKNKVMKNFIGMGYYNTIVPNVVLRNVIENPQWYTPYTPYQAEISQGRLESLLNFQTMISDLTGMPMSNSSLLDEGTAAAEAMNLCINSDKKKSRRFFVDEHALPQTIAVIRTRAAALGIDIVVGDVSTAKLDNCSGVFVQSPREDGALVDYSDVVAEAHANKCMVVVAADPLALTITKSPGEYGADVVVGTAQRFGVPLGFGGPHAGFLATQESFKRQMPGRIIGVSVDSRGKPALRMAMQTREQHIRRDKATSNICTAQALLANVSAFYGMYHGPEGLKEIARKVNACARTFHAGAEKLGHTVVHENYFDTVQVRLSGLTADEALAIGVENGVNVRKYSDDSICVSMDETTTAEDIDVLFRVLAGNKDPGFTHENVVVDSEIADAFQRRTTFMEHEVFNDFHSETEMMRYMYRLTAKDLSLVNAMIPLGSCTMKLNAATEMIPVTWPEVGSMHPFQPTNQTEGYQILLDQCDEYLSQITGFAKVSLQPNSGANGEFAGLVAIRSYLEAKGEHQRNVCIIPMSAHGTNPASAAMAGMKVVTVPSDNHGNVDVPALRAAAEKHKDNLAALMITYPSTHGVFEPTIREICDIIHENGGQVYMDGANLQAQVTFCSPGDLGADVCHLNLHKTFCIPHGGGGPGVGPIGVASHLVDYLPSHPVVNVGGEKGRGPVAAAPYGSASINVIPWAYIRMMGLEGLADATATSILNANYVAEKIGHEYKILYTGEEGRCAHEFIIDLRKFKETAGIEAADVAKRLMDYGFHAPTMSWPVSGTLMFEPTESESKFELDRFVEAMLCIREEIRAIEQGTADKENNIMKNAPHTADMLASSEWPHPYSRDEAAYPVQGLRLYKFWPTVGRLNDAHGDRNLVCSCPPLSAYGEHAA